MLATLHLSNNSTNQLQEQLLTVGELRFFAATMEIKKRASTECRALQELETDTTTTTIGLEVNAFRAVGRKSIKHQWIVFNHCILTLIRHILVPSASLTFLCPPYLTGKAPWGRGCDWSVFHGIWNFQISDGGIQCVCTYACL